MNKLERILGQRERQAQEAKARAAALHRQVRQGRREGRQHSQAGWKG